MRLNISRACAPATVAAIALLWSPLTAKGTTLVTAVERLGSVSASQVSSGLGFNINPSNEWEFRMAAEAGAVEGRVQFSWEAVENFDGDLALSPAAENALGWFAQYGLQPLIVAAYGPPRRRVLTITVGRDVPSGSYQILADEDLSGVEPFCHVQRSNGAQIVPEGRWAYYGALIHSVDLQNRSLTLAARTNVSLVAGDRLAVNCLRYSSIPNTDPADPSVLAYARY